MSEIPFANPKAEYLEHQDEFQQIIKGVLDGGEYILGSEVSQFETEFAAYIGAQFAVGVASGTDALKLSILALDLEAGDEVITVSHTAVATVAAIESAGAVPVLVDIDRDSYTMDFKVLEKAITPKTKAIVPVHLYGLPASLEPILKLAQDYHLNVIEDCAQSHGAMFQGKRTGSLGHLGAFSFYPTKNLGAIGDGGMVVTSDPNLYKRLTLLRQYGWEQRYISKIPGENSRLDTLQAALLRKKLQHLDENNLKRYHLAQLYSTGLTDKVQIPQENPGSTHVFHLYVIRTNQREALRTYLREKEIFTAIHYPLPIHLQPAYLNRVKISGKLITTEAVYPEILSLPMYPQLDEVSVRKVIEEINTFFE
jgi:dTDP-4-amino-4,6-dideoxygalactose transaminase